MEAAEMPRYQSHKKVWALKIQAITYQKDDSALITPEDTCYLPFAVDAEYIKRHRPQVGNYYVVYEDGYKSASPGDVFERGYTRL